MNNETIKQVAMEVFGKKASRDLLDTPYILCRRTLRRGPPLTYRLHDSSWEGLTKTTRNGVPAYEINKNFNLIILEDGKCLIPDTAFNRRRLELLSKPRQTMVRKVELDYSTMQQVEKMVPHIEAPTYQRLDETAMEKASLKSLARQLQELQEQAAETPFDPDGPTSYTHTAEIEETPAQELMQRAPKIVGRGKKAKATRGRPRGSSILSPIGGPDDDQ